MRRAGRLTVLLFSVLLLWMAVGCAVQESESGENGTAVQEYVWTDLRKTGSLDLSYAQQFQVDEYENGYMLLCIAQQEQFLLIPEGKSVPRELPEEITPLNLPIDELYLASSSVMDFYRSLDALDRVSMTSTRASDWSFPDVSQAVESGDILYVGKYSAPDYELILQTGCDLAVENTMIYHNPEAREKLEKLGIPVLVEYSSYEKDPLGRMEWIRLYGLLSGREEEAELFFRETDQAVSEVREDTVKGKSVAYFYFNAAGQVVIRKPGDYVTKMIEMAGGSYVFSELQPESENMLSTMKLQMEEFYRGAKDADILIYNSTIAGDLPDLDALIQKHSLMKKFRAVKSGMVYCTEQDMFQSPTAVSRIVKELHAVIGEDKQAQQQMQYLHQLL